MKLSKVYRRAFMKKIVSFLCSVVLLFSMTISPVSADYRFIYKPSDFGIKENACLLPRNNGDAFM